MHHVIHLQLIQLVNQIAVKVFQNLIVLLKNFLVRINFENFPDAFLISFLWTWMFRIDIFEIFVDFGQSLFIGPNIGPVGFRPVIFSKQNTEWINFRIEELFKDAIPRIKRFTSQPIGIVFVVRYKRAGKRCTKKIVEIEIISIWNDLWKMIVENRSKNILTVTIFTKSIVV